MTGGASVAPEPAAPPATRTRWPNTLLAFGVASLVATATVGVGYGLAASVREGNLDPLFQLTVVVLLFGWPFALAASLVLTPVYCLLRAGGRVTARAARTGGAVVGGVGVLAYGVARIPDDLPALRDHLTAILPSAALFTLAGALAGTTWWAVWQRDPGGQPDAAPTSASDAP